MRSFGPPPSAEEIEAIARRALDALPEPFADSLGDVVLLVEEFADDATLDAISGSKTRSSSAASTKAFR